MLKFILIILLYVFILCTLLFFYDQVGLLSGIKSQHWKKSSNGIWLSEVRGKKEP